VLEKVDGLNSEILIVARTVEKTIQKSEDMKSLIFLLFLWGAYLLQCGPWLQYHTLFNSK